MNNHIDKHYLIPSLFISALLGVISGAVWSLMLGVTFFLGMKYGALVGAIVGIMVFFLQNMATRKGGSEKGDALFGGSSILIFLFVVSIIISLVIGLLRWIF